MAAHSPVMAWGRYASIRENGGLELDREFGGQFNGFLFQG